MSTPLLRVDSLRVSVGDRVLVNDISFQVDEGEMVGIVGESGSGKTLTSLAVARLLPQGIESSATRLEFKGEDLFSPSRKRLRKLLGTDLAMVFQDPMSSLNPVLHIGTQMTEVVREHKGYSRAAARKAAISALNDVRVSQPEARMHQYPHELSGGMRQRVMIAMGLMTQSSLIIADEPTTALDVTVQAQVMNLICDLNRERGSAVLLISHNIALLSESCDRILVMLHGRLVESLSADSLLSEAKHPYTRALIRAVPDLNTDKEHELADVEIGDFIGSGEYGA